MMVDSTKRHKTETVVSYITADFEARGLKRTTIQAVLTGSRYHSIQPAPRGCCQQRSLAKPIRLVHCANGRGIELHVLTSHNKLDRRVPSCSDSDRRMFSSPSITELNDTRICCPCSYAPDITASRSIFQCVRYPSMRRSYRLEASDRKRIRIDATHWVKSSARDVAE